MSSPIEKITEELSKNLANTIFEIISELSVKIAAKIEKKLLLSFSNSNSYINYITGTVGKYPLFAANRIVSVEESYVIVSVSDRLKKNIYKNKNEILNNFVSRQKKSSSNDSQILDALQSTKHGFSLIGGPGSGKTTAFKYLGIYAANGNIIKGKKRLPFFVQVREIDDSEIPKEEIDNLILHLVVNQLKWLEIEEPLKVVNYLFKSGNLILLLDGFDEAKSSIIQDRIVKDIEKLRSKYSDCIYCLSSRPQSLERGINNFLSWEIQDLSEESKTLLIRKWFNSIDKEKGEILIEKLNSNKYLSEVANTPLFLSLICALFHNDLQLPQNIVDLYSRCIDGVLGGWDSFRNISRRTILNNLSINRRISLVSNIAGLLYSQKDIVFSHNDLEKTDFISFINDCYRLGYDIDSNILINTLCNDYGIIVEQSPKTFTFIHLSLHEYLAARYFVEERKEEYALKKYLNDDHWIEVIKLIPCFLHNSENFIRQYLNSMRIYNSHHIFLLYKILSEKPIYSQNLEFNIFDKFDKVLSEYVLKYDIKAVYTTLSDCNICLTLDFSEKKLFYGELSKLNSYIPIIEKVKTQYSYLYSDNKGELMGKSNLNFNVFNSIGIIVNILKLLTISSDQISLRNKTKYSFLFEVYKYKNKLSEIKITKSNRS